MRPQEEMGGWTTSASIRETLLSFIRSNPKDPIYNFRSFAFPALIRANWILGSWLLVLTSIASAVYIPIEAMRSGEKEFQVKKEAAETQRKEFSERINAKSISILRDDLGLLAFLQGGDLDKAKLFLAKQKISTDSDLYDILIFDKAVQSVGGTSSYDLSEQLGKNVWNVKIGKDNHTLAKFSASSDPQSRWIAVIWNTQLSLPAINDSTVRRIGEAIITDILILVGLVIGFLFDSTRM